MARLLAPVVELGLGGSYFGQVVADAGVRIADWRMDLVTDVYSGGAAQMMVVNRGESHWGPLPVGYKGLRLFSGSSPITDRLERQVIGAVPDGWPGLRLSTSGSEWGQMVGSSSDNAHLIHTLTWTGVIESLPSGDVALVDQVSSSFAAGGMGLWFDSSGVLHGRMHSGSVVNSDPLSTGTLYQFKLTREGTTGNQTWKLYVNGVLVDTAAGLTTVVVSATPVILVGANAHTSASVFLDATVYHVGVYRSDSLTLTPLDAPTIASHWAALQWTDVSRDVMPDFDGLVIERGFRSADVLERVAPTGTLTFSLDNTTLNLAGTVGYYSPGHGSAAAAFRRGTPVRVTLLGRRQFRGQIHVVTPDPGSRGMRVTRVLAVDSMDQAGVTRVAGVPLLEDVRSDIMVEAVTARLPIMPAGLAIREGRDTFPIAFDNARDEKLTVAAEWRRIHGSEFGRLYQKADGTLMSESRGTRVEEHVTPVLTLDADLLEEIEVSEISAKTITRVEVTTHAKREGSSPEVLASAGAPIYVRGSLEGSPPETIILPFRSLTGQSLNQRVGGKNMIPPESPTDWEAWHQVAADGSGQAFEQTADVDVTAVFSSNSVEITIVNNHIFNTYVIGLQVRGTAIFDFQPVVSVVDADDETIERDGLQPIQVDMVYQADPAVGRAVAEWILASQVSPTVRAVRLLPHVDVTSPDMLSLDISDRVRVVEAQTGISGDFHIQGVRLEIGAEGQHSLLWWLAPADPNTYWVVGVPGASELGSTTVLFPA